MKLPTLLLLGSLAANAAFVGFHVFKKPAGDSLENGRAIVMAGQATGDGAGGKTSSTSASGAAARDTAPLSKLWAQVQSGDLRTLADRLRAAGFPPSAIKAIVSAEIYEQFAARRKALLGQQEEVPFWKTQQRAILDPKAMAELRQISREQTNLMKELLGPDGYLGSDEVMAFQKRQFGDLPRDTLDQMQNVLSDYNELRQQIYQAANGVMLPEDREKLALLEKEQRTDLAKLLTPQQLEEYDLRSSNTANTLRSQLVTFKPTEAEFRALYKATRDAEEKIGSLTNAGGNPDQMRQIQAAALENARAVLPADRFAELKQAVDPLYQQVNRLVARLELPTSAATEVVTVQQDIQKRATAVRGNRELSAEQRNEQLGALAQEASAKISTALGGTRGLEAYKQYGGQWLQTIVPRPAPAAPGAPPPKG